MGISLSQCEGVSPVPTPAQHNAPLAVGAVGASITIERGGKNWPEQLLKYRHDHYYFGPEKTGPQSWPVHEFIHSAEDTAHFPDIVEQLAAQVRAGQVAVAYIENALLTAQQYRAVYLDDPLFHADKF